MNKEDTYNQRICQCHSNLDNWGAGLIFIYSCSQTIKTMDFRTRVYMSPPPIIELATALYADTHIPVFIKSWMSVSVAQVGMPSTILVVDFNDLNDI